MKKIRTLLPLSIYDIPGIQRWLEERADGGLFPVYLDSWVTFTPTGVPGTRFRLEPWGKAGTEPSEEQLALYRQAGWEYAFPVGRVYFLFYTTDPEARELYTDLESRGMSLERLEKRVRSYRRSRAAVCALLAALLVWAVFFSAGRFDVQPAPLIKLPLLLLDLFHPFVLLALAVIAFFAWQGRRDYRILTRTCQALREGLPPPPSPGPSRAFAREQLLTLVLTAVFLMGQCLLLLQNRGRFTVPVDEFTRPYIALQALEDVELESFEALFGPSSFHEGENQAENHLSLLAPVWYTVTQNGYLAEDGDYAGCSPDPRGGKYRYSPSLDASYFHLLSPALARPVARSQLDRDRAVNLYWTYEELSCPGLDFVILATEPDGIYQGLALGKGGRIAVFHYGGVERLTDHMELLAGTVRAS